MKLRVFAVAGAVALAASVVVAPSAQAQNVIDVQMSRPLGKGLRDAFSVRPGAPIVDGVPTIEVARDGIVHLVDSPAILLPEGMAAMDWVDQYARGSDAPWAPIVADPDGDLPGLNAPSRLNIPAFDPTVEECGASAADPCVFDGSNPDPIEGVMSSGDIVSEFFVQITAQPNATIDVIPLVLASDELVSLRIRVIAQEGEATTQAELDGAAQDVRAQERATALEIKKEINSVSRTREGDHWVYDAFGGYDTETIILFGFYPRKLQIKKGDRVVWHFPLALEAHTASFPFKKGLKAGNRGFAFACDPDGSGEGPDTPPGRSEEDPCNPGEPELDLSRKITAQAGDGQFPGGSNKYENSGLKAGWLPTDIDGVKGGTEDWALAFNARSSDKGFKYICIFHGRGMTGKVIVK
ncbi:MAG TPA: hypothetical protein VNP73_07715 [Actinomycetota bacterium]|nr:hypothetical protein [Actinomycetota bacterium]